LLEMTNGVRISYEAAKSNASELNGWCNDYWRAECDRATLELDNRRLRKTVGKPGNAGAVEELPLATQAFWMNTWLAEMFVDWLNDGPPPPNALDDNIQCAALLFAAIESAETGRVVDVQEFLQSHRSA